MNESKASGMAFFFKGFLRIARCTALGAPATVALVFLISSCGNFDIRRDRVSSGGLAETPADKAIVSREAGGVISNGVSRYTLAAAGDTVASIAQRFGIDAGELSRMNGKHPSETLSEGAVIVLPEIAPSEVELEKRDAAWPSPEPIAQIRYKVQRGDTAFSIARSFGVSARIIAEWNNLGPGFEVRENQILLIPAPRDSAASDAALSNQFDDVHLTSGGSERLSAHELDAELPPSPQMDQYRTEAGNKPRMLIPVKGEIIKKYTGAGGNEGIDIAALPGTAVRAADDGTVALVTRATDQTIILLLRHEDDLYTVYSNLEETELEQYDRVLRGQPLGKSAGGEPPFVHFEVRIGANSVDPETYL